MDVPDEQTLGTEPENGKDEGDEYMGLVVEDGDGLVGGAKALEEAKLTAHCCVGRHSGGVERVCAYRWGVDAGCLSDVMG